MKTGTIRMAHDGTCCCVPGVPSIAREKKMKTNRPRDAYDIAKQLHRVGVYLMDTMTSPRSLAEVQAQSIVLAAQKLVLAEHHLWFESSGARYSDDSE